MSQLAPASHDLHGLHGLRGHDEPLESYDVEKRGRTWAHSPEPALSTREQIALEMVRISKATLPATVRKTSFSRGLDAGGSDTKPQDSGFGQRSCPKGEGQDGPSHLAAEQFTIFKVQMP